MNYKNNSIPRHVLGNSNILPQSHANQSMFNLSEDLKTTIGFDKLYPVYWEELNPGDKFDVSVKTLGRLMPMVAPVMSNIKLKYFAFFVPNRLLWKNWTKFMGEKQYQDDSTEYVMPQVSLAGYGTSTLVDYMGVPPLSTGTIGISALPFRAYRKIWNEWFRANEIQAPLQEFSDDFGDDSDSVINLLKKGKPLDYFTSCLPYPQAGEPVMVPLGGQAPVASNGFETNIIARTGSGDKFNARIDGTSLPPTGQWSDAQVVNIGPATYGLGTNLYADMSAVTGVSVEMLRKASSLQVLLERDARAGETYIDLMNTHFGTTVPDFLVGRSQYLGSSTTFLNVEPIAQNSATTDVSPQGNLSAVGIGVNGDKLCEISAVEHGIFMILACADADLSYSQGIPRKFSKYSRYDYMFPEFHNLGDQAVYNREIFVTGTDKDFEVFGYQERYRELREGINKVSGLMRHSAQGSLDVWHLGQKFNNLPTLSPEFIESNTPIDRVMAVPTEDQIILNTYFDIKATRTLPVSSNPSLLAGRV